MEMAMAMVMGMIMVMEIDMKWVLVSLILPDFQVVETIHVDLLALGERNALLVFCLESDLSIGEGSSIWD